MKLIEAVMNRPFLMIVSVVLILLYGGMSAYQMERDYLPSMNNSTLMITVRAQHLQANQVKANVAGMIEKAVRGVNGIDYIESNSFNGGLLCSLYFPFDFDVGHAEGEVAQTLASLAYPEGVDKPLVTRVSTSSFPIMRISLTGNSGKLDETALRTSIQNDIANQLRSVPGVGEVRITGGGNNGYMVTVRMNDLKKSGFTLEDVNRSLGHMIPAWQQGRIVNNEVSIPIQLTGKEINTGSIKKLLVQGTNGKTMPLSTVADVSPTVVDMQMVSRTGGKPSVILDVLKTSSANITKVSDQVHSRLNELKEVQSGDVHSTVLFDRGNDVKASINSLIKEGLFGCLFSMLSVFIFLRNVRSTLLIAISLPVSLLASIAFLKWMGISFNILTISGLVVAMGRVVDDSIVVMDNIYRRMQESRERFTKHSMAAAVREMIPAIVSSTATTIVVFLPVLFVGGITQSAFSSFAWTVIAALVVSLFVSILVVPALTHLWWRNSTIHAPQTKPAAEKLLHWALRRRKTVVWSTLLIFLMTAAGAVYLPVNFLPASGPREISIKVELPEDSPLASMDAEIKRVEALLASEPEKAETFSATLGSSFIPQFDDVFDEGGGWIQEDHVANMVVTVKSGVDMDGFITELQGELRSLRGDAIYTVTNRNIGGDDSKLKVMVTGADRATLENTAQLIRGKLQLVPGLSVEGANDAGPKYRLAVNQQQIERAGVKPEKVLEAIKPYQADGTRLSLTTDISSTPIIIKTDRLNQASGIPGKDLLSSLGEETVQANDGRNVSLKQLVTVEKSNELSVIRERDGRSFAVVSTDIVSKDIEKVTAQTEEVIKGLSLPAGVHYSFGGISGQVKQMITEMAIALAVSIFLIVLIISAVFRGWKAPLSVLVCIPLALVGSVLGLVLFGKQWDLASLIGVMMLTGIVVTNGIVLVDKIERNIAGGMAVREAILQGTLSRVRPVLMTACTTILTLLPLAIFNSRDTVISQTLGIVVVGGMISSTFISLLVIPIMYDWLHRKQRPTHKIIEEPSALHIS
ncbi:efflux RND transporter permease subunit [Aneurinibacillus tyrosinisolvens]|uniref:efflux RND transporter permease subunit n=1 Tax=Aneurinibacillus tyrosinisolvens TaxID=1443435 RepID=UPI00063F161A|nr:efflux RND transporter permease subunit [Aneurinibacillus tyrosinisolvens]